MNMLNYDLTKLSDAYTLFDFHMELAKKLGYNFGTWDDYVKQLTKNIKKNK